jgi:hypothetical protein
MAAMKERDRAGLQQEFFFNVTLEHRPAGVAVAMSTVKQPVVVSAQTVRLDQRG